MQMLFLESQLASLPRSMQNFLVSLHWEAELPLYADVPLACLIQHTVSPGIACFGCQSFGVNSLVWVPIASPGQLCWCVGDAR